MSAADLSAEADTLFFDEDNWSAKVAPHSNGGWYVTVVKPSGGHWYALGFTTTTEAWAFVRGVACEKSAQSREEERKACLASGT